MANEKENKKKEYFAMDWIDQLEYHARLINQNRLKEEKKIKQENKEKKDVNS